MRSVHGTRGFFREVSFDDDSVTGHDEVLPIGKPAGRPKTPVPPYPGEQLVRHRSAARELDLQSWVRAGLNQHASGVVDEPEGAHLVSADRDGVVFALYHSERVGHAAPARRRGRDQILGGHHAPARAARAGGDLCQRTRGHRPEDPSIAGSRDRPLADAPDLDYLMAAEILFLIETLEKTR